MFKRTIDPTVRIKNILCQRRWPMYSKNAVVWLAFAFDEPFTILWEKFQFLRNKDAYLSHNGHAKCQWSVSFSRLNCHSIVGIQWVYMCINECYSTQYDTILLISTFIPFFFIIIVSSLRSQSFDTNTVTKQFTVGRTIKCRLVFKAISRVYCIAESATLMLSITSSSSSFSSGWYQTFRTWW